MAKRVLALCVCLENSLSSFQTSLQDGQQSPGEGCLAPPHSRQRQDASISHVGLQTSACPNRERALGKCIISLSRQEMPCLKLSDYSKSTGLWMTLGQKKISLKFLLLLPQAFAPTPTHLLKSAGTSQISGLLQTQRKRSPIAVQVRLSPSSSPPAPAFLSPVTYV